MPHRNLKGMGGLTGSRWCPVATTRTVKVGENQTEVTELDGEEAERVLAAIKREELAGQGLRPFLKLPDGVTTEMSFVEKAPILQTKNSYGRDQFLIPVVVDGEEYDLALGCNSPALPAVLALRKAGVRTIAIARTGSGRETRYTVTRVEE